MDSSHSPAPPKHPPHIHSNSPPVWYHTLFARVVGVLSVCTTATLTIAALLIPLSPWTVLICALLCTASVVYLLQARPASTHKLQTKHILLLALVCFLLRPLWVVTLSPIKSVVLPTSSKLPSLHWVVDEHDLAMLGAWGVSLGGFVRPLEASEMLPAMQDSYSSLAVNNGPAPTALLNTALLGQSPKRFDTLVVPAPEPTTRVLIFLHGYGSNFTLPCWHVAQAAQRAGYLTLCPSTTFDGRWQSRASRAIIHHTIRYARETYNADSIVLAGLSAGGIGASLVAPSLREELDGLILISGVSGRAQPVAGLPTLVLHGRKDSMTPFKHALRYAQKRRKTVNLQPLDGRHFILLAAQDQTLPALESWLGERNR